MDTKNDVNYARRDLIGAVALSLTAGSAPSVAAPSAVAAPLADPTTKFPKPPFHDQKQPWPGLASKMDPKPDHGEGSYQGSGRLAGRRALITGGDSGMGRAAAIAFAREGADVAISYFPDEEPDAQDVIKIIREAGRKAVALPGDIRSEAVCKNEHRLAGDQRVRGPRYTGEQRRSPASARFHSRYHDRAVRLDDED
jgi:hypothetical protein